MAHFVWPVMKLPGRILTPCRNQTHPTNRQRIPNPRSRMRIVIGKRVGDGLLTTLELTCASNVLAPHREVQAERCGPSAHRSVKSNSGLDGKRSR